jgi:ribosomal protein S12 methylthiotransferase accessory factor
METLEMPETLETLETPPAPAAGPSYRAAWLSPCPAGGAGWRRAPVEAMLAVAQREARALGLPGHLTALNGKGWTAEESRLGALMELLERHWGQRPAVAWRLARPSELAAELFLPPGVVPLPYGLSDPGDAPLAWVPGTSFWGAEVLVPAHDVLAPFVPPAGAANPPVWRRAGLAAGGHPTEAVFHGLLELLERDAVAVAELAQGGVRVDLATSGSPWIARLLPRLASHGIRLEVCQLPTMGGATTYLASLEDGRAGSPERPIRGHAAHLDPYLALERAVLEALQARAMILAGAADEEVAGEGAAPRHGSPERREPDAATVPAPASPLPLPADLAEVVLACERALRREGFQPLVVIEMTPPGSPVPVVRVVLPGCSDLSHGAVRLGRRLCLAEAA